MKELLEYAAFRVLQLTARVLPFRVAGILGSFLGAIVYRCTPFRKSVVHDNLRAAFPGLSRGEIRRIALGAFRNYGIALVHMLWAGGQKDAVLQRVVRLANREVFDAARARGRGVILLSGHFGSWELLVHSVRLNLGEPAYIIVQRQRNKRIDALVNASRTLHGNVTIPMGPSAREALRALAGGNILYALGDQSGPRESEFVSFFGRPAATHRGVAAFSLRTGAPIVMVVLLRQPQGTYEAVFEEVDRTGLDGSSAEAIHELTQRHASVLERHIRRHPDHWLWMHKRWKHTGYYESHRSGEDVLHAGMA